MDWTFVIFCGFGVLVILAQKPSVVFFFFILLALSIYYQDFFENRIWPILLPWLEEFKAKGLPEPVETQTDPTEVNVESTQTKVDANDSGTSTEKVETHAAESETDKVVTASVESGTDKGESPTKSIAKVQAVIHEATEKIKPKVEHFDHPVDPAGQESCNAIPSPDPSDKNRETKVKGQSHSIDKTQTLTLTYQVPSITRRFEISETSPKPKSTGEAAIKTATTDAASESTESKPNEDDAPAVVEKSIALAKDSQSPVLKAETKVEKSIALAKDSQSAVAVAETKGEVSHTHAAESAPTVSGIEATLVSEAAATGTLTVSRKAQRDITPLPTDSGESTYFGL